jgi:hypothetical protein
VGGDGGTHAGTQQLKDDLQKVGGGQELAAPCVPTSLPHFGICICRGTLQPMCHAPTHSSPTPARLPSMQVRFQLNLDMNEGSGSNPTGNASGSGGNGSGNIPNGSSGDGSGAKANGSSGDGSGGDGSGSGGDRNGSSAKASARPNGHAKGTSTAPQHRRHHHHHHHHQPHRTHTIPALPHSGASNGNGNAYLGTGYSGVGGKRY